MTDKEKRLEIAFHCGWSHHAWGWSCEGRSIPTPDGERYFPFSDIPDYLYDLNAMHGAEKRLTPMQRLSYQTRWLPYVYHNGIDVEPTFLSAPIDATARQRADAFLYAIGKLTYRHVVDELS